MQIKDPKSTCFALIGVFVVVFACIGILRLSRNISSAANLSYYDLDWNIIINEKISEENNEKQRLSTFYGKQRLSSFVFPELKRDTVIQLFSVAPEFQDIDYINMEFEIDDCGVEVFKNNECVFRQNMERFKNHKYIGSGLLNIPLVNLEHGDKLQINLYVNENNAFSMLKPVKFAPMSKSSVNYVRQNLFTFICNAFLLILGMIGFLLSFAFWTYRRKAMSLLVLSHLVFWSSMCLFCKHRFVQFFSLNFALNTELAYASLEISLTCVFLLYYLCFANTDLIRKIYKIAMWVLMVFFSTLWILHFTNVWHLSGQIVYLRALLIILGIYGFAVSCCIIIVKPLVKSVSALGFFLLCIFFLYDYVYYFVFFMTMGSFAFNRNNWFVFGIISLGVCLIIDFIFQLVNSAAEDIGTHVVEQSRSVDFVTDVLTREAIVEKFSYFEKSNKNYTLISFDFINMPDVSTKAGAESFYDSIAFFAGLIKHVFGIVSEIGRISNSSFIVLSSEISEKRLQQMLLVFQSILNSDDKYGKDVSIMVGSAFSNEIKESSCYSLYSLAQQRRYVLNLSRRTGIKKL